MSRFRIAIVGAVLVALGFAVAAFARPDPPPGGPAVYLALGDSAAAGVGTEPAGSSYPEQLAAQLQRGYDAAANIDLVNYAVGGATTATLIKQQLPEAIQLIEQRDGDGDSFNDVKVITVTIGGNDIFGPVLAACIPLDTPAACQRTVDKALVDASNGLQQVLAALGAAADRDSDIVITTYYNPVPTCSLGAAPDAVAVADAVLEGGNVDTRLAVQDGLNDLIRNAASATGVQVTDLYSALADPVQFVGGDDCLHPSGAGHTSIADAILETLTG